jgi:TonB family protein
MNRTLLVVFALFIGVYKAYAQGVSVHLNESSHNTSAIDSKGVRHDGHAYKGIPPWNLDRIKAVAPNYPFEERRLRHQGRAIVRLTLDINTGRVVKATLLKSTGYSGLDNSAIAAFSQWTWRPGRWKEIDEAVTFHLRGSMKAPAAESRRTRHCMGDPVSTELTIDSPLPPALKQRDHFSGRLRLFLHSDGSVDHIKFEEHFDYPALDSIALDIFRKWKFRPDRPCDIITIPLTLTVKKG